MKKRKLYGFGNRIYKNFDPRAKIIQKVKILIKFRLPTMFSKYVVRSHLSRQLFNFKEQHFKMIFCKL